MTRDGVTVLNDQTVADVVPDTFSVRGRVFDLGPGRGVTKGEYRDFGVWFNEVASGDGEVVDVPERWMRFERK